MATPIKVGDCLELGIIDNGEILNATIIKIIKEFDLDTIITATKEINRTLPYSYARCWPETAESKCRTCMRFEFHLWQTFGPGTPVMLNNPVDEKCGYISVEEYQK